MALPHQIVARYFRTRTLSKCQHPDKQDLSHTLSHMQCLRILNSVVVVEEHSKSGMITLSESIKQRCGRGTIKGSVGFLFPIELFCKI
jgi:hypothetical protein